MVDESKVPPLLWSWLWPGKQRPPLDPFLFRWRVRLMGPRDVCERKREGVREEARSEARAAGRPSADRPWPAFDSCEAAMVVELVRVTGSDPVEALRYERENGVRAEVLAALEREIDKNGATE